MEHRPYKVVLVGKHGIGKTRIFYKLQQVSDDTNDHLTTVSTGTGAGGTRAQREKWMVHMTTRGNKVTVVLWDTGGAEKYGAGCLTRSYFTKSHGVILVYDSGDLETLHELRDWIELTKDYCDKTVVFSLCGHSRGNDTNPVDEDTVRDFAAKYGISSSLIFTVDSSTGDNILDFFKTVVEVIHLNVTQPRRAQEEFNISPLKAEEQQQSKCFGKCGC